MNMGFGIIRPRQTPNVAFHGYKIALSTCPYGVLVSRTFRAWLFSLLVSAALAQSRISVRAPAAEGKPQNGAFVLHASAREVLLYCTVLDKHGNLMTELDRSAFKVLEDHVPMTIIRFDRRDVPVSLSLVLDDSGSMADKRAGVQSAAIDLIRDSNAEDETAVTNFADQSYLDQDFTDNLSTLQTALGQSKTVSGGTALFDTVISAADHLAKAAHHTKQVIVVVTDGRDNASTNDLSAAIRRVQSADGPVIYTIGLLYDVPASEARRARHDLQDLSDETGGIAFFPSSVAEVDKVAGEVARDIRNQYTISYRPPAPVKGDGYRTIQVTAISPARAKLTVRTRKGYFLRSGPPSRP